MRDLPLDAGRNYKGPICGIHALQGYIRYLCSLQK